MKRYFLFFVLIICGCDMSNNDSAKISRIFDEASDGEVVHLSSHIDREGVDICILVPYQSMLRDDGSDHSRRLNQAISQEKIDVGEGVWHLLLWNGESLEDLSFRVNPSYEVKQGGFGEEFLSLFSKMKFQNASCAEIKRFGFVKYQIKNRTYMTFGVEE